MSRPHLEDHLLLLAQIKRLDVTPLAQVPDVQVVSVSALEELFRHDAAFNLARCAPLAGQQRILGEMPPEIVAKILWSDSHLPRTSKVK